MFRLQAADEYYNSALSVGINVKFLVISADVVLCSEDTNNNQIKMVPNNATMETRTYRSRQKAGPGHLVRDKGQRGNPASPQ